jgi:hypothetical protein
MYHNNYSRYDIINAFRRCYGERSLNIEIGIKVP